MRPLILVSLLLPILFVASAFAGPMSPEEAQRLLEKADARYKQSDDTPAEEPQRKAEAGPDHRNPPPVVEFDIADIQPPAADMLDYVLRQAIDRGYETVVLVIDSPGGQVAEGERLADVIDEHDGDIEIVAYVKSAISASIWPVLACQTVHAEAGSTIGGAQVFFQDHSTGNLLVDNKMVSISAAMTRGLCEKNGHPWEFVEPMVLAQPTGRKVSEVYTDWVDAETPVERTRMVDEKTVQTNTAEEALAAGLADSVVDDLDDIYERRDTVAVDHVSAYFASLYVSRYMQVFYEHYNAELIDYNWPRTWVTRKRWVSTINRNSDTLQTYRRLQTDEEWDRAATSAVRTVKGARIYAEKAERDIETFLESGRPHIFRIADEPRRRWAARYIADTLRSQALVMKKSLDEVSPAVEPPHYEFAAYILDNLAKLCEENAGS